MEENYTNALKTAILSRRVYLNSSRQNLSHSHVYKGGLLVACGCIQTSIAIAIVWTTRDGCCNSTMFLCFLWGFVKFFHSEKTQTISESSVKQN